MEGTLPVADSVLRTGSMRVSAIDLAIGVEEMVRCDDLVVRLDRDLHLGDDHQFRAVRLRGVDGFGEKLRRRCNRCLQLELSQ